MAIGGSAGIAQARHGADDARPHARRHRHRGHHASFKRSAVEDRMDDRRRGRGSDDPAGHR